MIRIRPFRIILCVLGSLLIALGAYAWAAPGIEPSLRLPISLLSGGVGVLLIIVGLFRPPQVVRRAVEDMFDGD